MYKPIKKRNKLGPIPEAPKPHRLQTFSKIERYGLFISLILILLFGSLYLLKPEITGRAILEGNITSYTQELNLQINQPQGYEFELEQHPELFNLKSLTLSGTAIGDGNFKIYLEDENGNKYLILDRSMLEKELPRITGYAIKEESEINETPDINQTLEINETPEINETQQTNITPDLNQTINETEQPELNQTPENQTETPEINQTPEEQIPPLQSEENQTQEIPEEIRIEFSDTGNFNLPDLNQSNYQLVFELENNVALQINSMQYTLQELIEIEITEEFNTSFSFNCQECIENEIPTETQTQVILTLITPTLQTSKDFILYYPSSWTILDADMGYVEVYNNETYKIKWQISSSTAKELIFKTPRISNTYNFQAEFDNKSSEIWQINVIQNITNETGLFNWTRTITNIYDNLSEEITMNLMVPNSLKPIADEIDKKENTEGNKKGFSITSSDDEKTLDELKQILKHELNDVYPIAELNPGIGPIKNIKFYDIEIINDTISVGIEEVGIEGYIQSYAIDPTQLDFTNATVTVTAKGSELYKCKDWNFAEKICYGEWIKVMDLIPGEEYIFTLTAEDPAFGEISITNAAHLDENREFISDIYNETYQLDNIWSETIPANHYVRVTFKEKLTNENDITLYPRTVNGTPRIEVYEVDGTELIAEFDSINDNEYDTIYLTNLQGSQDIFDLLIRNGDIQIDHIIDPYYNNTVFNEDFTPSPYYNYNWTRQGTDWDDANETACYSGPNCAHADGTCTEAADWILTNSSLINLSDALSARVDFRISTDVDFDPGDWFRVWCTNSTGGYIKIFEEDGGGWTGTAWVNRSASVNSSCLIGNARFRITIIANNNNEDVHVDDFIVVKTIISDTAPNTTLNYPSTNYYNDTSSPFNLTFNCSATDDINLKNISLYITNSTNQSFLLNKTTNISGTSNSTTWNLSLSNGNYTWNCLACDNASHCDWGDVNRTIKINYSIAPPSLPSYPINCSNYKNTNPSITPILKTITIDGDMSDWDGVIQNSNNILTDKVSGNGDLDTVQTADRDLTEFAYTWDSNYIYFYFGRVVGGSNTVSPLVYVDFNNDGYMNSTDKVLRFTWGGSNRKYNSDLLNYIPSGGTPDILTGDGVDMPGSITDNASLETQIIGGDTDGIKLETRVNWSSLGIPAEKAFKFHVAMAQAGGTNLPSQLEDNIDNKDKGTGYAFVVFEKDEFGAGKNGSNVVYIHGIANCGNVNDTIDITNTSTLSWSSNINFTNRNFIDTDGDSKPDTGILAPGDYLTVIVNITIPASASQNSKDITTITGTSSYNTNISDYVKDTTLVGAISIIQDRTGKIRNNSNIRYNFTITNYQTTSDVIEVTANSNHGWATYLYYSNGTLLTDTDGDSIVDTGNLSAGSSQDILLEIIIPNIAIGTIDITNVTINSSISSAYSYATATTIINQPLEIYPDNSGATGIGTSMFYSHEVCSNSNQTDVIDLTYNSSQNWTVQFYEANKVIALTDTDSDSLIDVGALAAYGSCKNISVKITIPTTTAENTTDITTIYANSSLNPILFDIARDNTTAKKLLTYNCAFRTSGCVDSSFYNNEIVYARAHSLTENNVYFVWINSNNTLVETSPDIPKSSDGHADDDYNLNNTQYFGNWTLIVYNAQNDNEITRTIFTVLANCTDNETSCFDGIDNDCDGYIDINDTDCTLPADVTPPEANQSSPLNGTSTINTTLNFTCNATDDVRLKNISLFIWNSTNGIFYQNSANISGFVNSSTWQVSGFTVGDYKWNCLAFDTSNNPDWGDYNWSFSIIANCTDNDGDGYNSTNSYCGPIDCNDNNISIYPGATEICNNIDDNCDTIIDNITQSCGTGNCTGNTTCIAGIWSNCSSYNNDIGVCAKCNETGSAIYDSSQNSDCNPFDLSEIATCTNNPDNVPYTWDYAAAFDSQCAVIYNCTQGSYSFTHSCSISNCSAQCELNSDCNSTECDYLDGCYSGTYRNYSDVSNICNANCTCSNNSCGIYTQIPTDNDGDGFDIECDNDCDDNNNLTYPGAIELCDNIDNNCNNQTDENLTQACGTGICTGIQTCAVGVWSVCNTSGIDAGICAICNASGDPAYDPSQSNDCNTTICPSDGCGSGCPPNIFGNYPDNVTNFCSVIYTCTNYTCSASCESDGDTDNYSASCGDCDDLNSSINPNATEICNNIDDNCNNLTDENLSIICNLSSDCGINSCIAGTYYIFTCNNNGTCFSSCSNTTNITDNDLDGFDIQCDNDCDDADNTVYPGAPELCDNKDNDCDTIIDEGFTNETCHYVCQSNNFTWTNNGGNLNCCGNDALEDSPFEINETSCSDGNDNDCDGLIDDIDNDCVTGGMPKCHPMWQCDKTWSECINGLQTRICKYKNNCGTHYNDYIDTKSCPREEYPLPVEKIEKLDVLHIEDHPVDNQIHIVWTNAGDALFENVTVKVIKPELETAFLIHPRKIWSLGGNLGWSPNFAMREPVMYKWYVEDPKLYEQILPSQVIDTVFNYTPSPLAFGEYALFRIEIIQKGIIIFNSTVLVSVNVTNPLILIPYVHEDEKIVDIYMVISNLDNKDKTFNVEFDLNKASSEGYEFSTSLLGFFDSIVNGPRTITGDLLGPYNIKSKDTILLAYQYKYTDEFVDNYIIRASLFDNMNKITTTQQNLNLKK